MAACPASPPVNGTHYDGYDYDAEDKYDYGYYDGGRDDMSTAVRHEKPVAIAIFILAVLVLFDPRH